MNKKLLEESRTAKQVHIAVDLADIRAEIPRTLYGTCLEDVNHEIYGGLDAQRLYDESFEETQPFAPLPHDIEGASGKVCGRQWTKIATGGGECRQPGNQGFRHARPRGEVHSSAPRQSNGFATTNRFLLRRSVQLRACKGDSPFRTKPGGQEHT